ncbi:DUF58 domain-containing protein [Lapidilactobacillus salsurivasis]
MILRGHWRHWRRNLGTTIVLLLLFILGPIFNTPTSWLITDFAGVTLIFSGLSLLWPLTRLKITTDPQPLRAHSHVPINLRLEGPGFFASLAVRQGQQIYWRGTYYGRTRQVIWPNHLDRGIHQELPLTLQAWDLLGIATKQHQVQLSRPLIVGPATEAGLSQALLDGLADFVRRANADDATPSFDLESLRDYRPGIPLHSIDWKVSARRDKTTVRKNRPEQKPQWAGVLLGTPGPAFEALLGAFTTIDQETHLWQRGFYLGAKPLIQPSWTQLAAWTTSPELPSQLPDTLEQTPALIVFSATPLTYAAASAHFPKQKLILVCVAPTTLTISTNKQQVQLQWEVPHDPRA